MKDLLLCVDVVVKSFTSFGRLRQRFVLKWVPYVQHGYFSSFHQSDHCFLASSLPLLSSLLKLPIYRVEVAAEIRATSCKFVVFLYLYGSGVKSPLSHIFFRSSEEYDYFSESATPASCWVKTGTKHGCKKSVTCQMRNISMTLIRSLVVD